MLVVRGSLLFVGFLRGGRHVAGRRFGLVEAGWCCAEGACEGLEVVEWLAEGVHGWWVLFGFFVGLGLGDQVTFE